MKVDVSVLDELVHEYCIYRGIVDPGPTNSGESWLFKLLLMLN